MGNVGYQRCMALEEMQIYPKAVVSNSILEYLIYYFYHTYFECSKYCFLLCDIIFSLYP